MGRAAVAFESVLPLPPSELPRMDVAAFVGFADSGPLDAPVAIESAAHFRDVFGADPALAFDALLGDFHRGYLGSAVEAFFANGGRRCWVVRVAAEPERIELEVPGLLRLDLAGGVARSGPARAPARSAGAWAKGLRAHATLRELPLGGLVGPAPGLGVRAGRPWLRVAQPPGAIAVGDLLRVTAQGSDLQLFVVVGAVSADERGSVLASAQHVIARARAAPGASAERVSSPLELVASPALQLSGPWSSAEARVERLSFDLSVWSGETLRGRVERLAFSARHPRFWGNLPSDDQLYLLGAGPRADQRDDELAALWAEAEGQRGAAAASGRFALAGAEPSDGRAASGLLYLPDGMSREPKPLPAPPERGASAAPRSGLESIDARVFIDERLRNMQGDSLLRTAELLHGAFREQARLEARGTRSQSRREQPSEAPEPASANTRLRGLHALLPIDEVTLVAVPDAVHPRRSDVAAAPDVLGAPTLLAARIVAPDELLITWRQVPLATSYQLELAERPDFSLLLSRSAIEHDRSSGAAPRETRVELAPACEQQLCVRLHALRAGEPSPWSETLMLRRDGGAFAPCATLVVESSPRLELDEAGQLRFRAGSGGLPEGALFLLESAADPLFLTAKQARITTEPGAAPAATDAPRYFRVRLQSADGASGGPWSNTVVYQAPTLSRPELVPGSFELALLLSVHRALLRLCHARGDVLALLTLPKAFAPAHVTDYLAALTPSGEASASSVEAGVERPLSLGEEGALSYAALYFPWTAQSSGAGVPSGRPLPADGIVAGELARLALGRGAWIAAANRPLTAVLALEPRLSDRETFDLLELAVNVLGRTAAGFVALDEQTLSRDASTRSIAVRRLLILVKRLVLREGNALLFEPNDADLAEGVVTGLEHFLTGLHQRGAFSGETTDQAFQVSANDSASSRVDIDAGRLLVELRVAPSEPLKFLRVRLVQNGSRGLAVGER